MDALGVDIKKFSTGVLKWFVSAIGFFVLSGIIAYLARDLIGTYTGLLMIVYLFVAGFVAFAVFLAIVLEPLEWLRQGREPGGAPLERRLEEARNGVIFDIMDLVVAASLPIVGPKISEFQKAHPNPTPEETTGFWDQLRDDAAKGHIVPLDEEDLEELGLATEYLDTISEIRAGKDRAHRQLRHFVYASAAYYPGSILAAAVAAGFAFDVGSVAGILYSGALLVIAYARFGFGPNIQKLRWWRKTLESLKDKDSRGVKRAIEEMKPPPFARRRHL